MSAEIKRPIEGQASIFEYLPIEEREIVLPNPFKNVERVLKSMEKIVEEETKTPESEYRLQIIKKSIDKIDLAKDCGSRTQIVKHHIEKNEAFLKMDILEKPMGEYITDCDLKKSYESLCEQFLKQAEIIKQIHTLGGYRSNLDTLPHTNDGLKKTGRMMGTENMLNIKDKKNGVSYDFMFGVKPRVILSVNTKKICD